MKARNSNIGKLVIGLDSPLPSANELSNLNYIHSTSKASFSQNNLPEIILSKNVIVSPPVTEFKIQDYPLKRIQNGMNGWDWQTEVNDENDLQEKPICFKPTKSSSSNIFPASSLNLFKTKKQNSRLASIEEITPTPKEFNRKLDRVAKFRESMLKAQSLFNIY